MRNRRSTILTILGILTIGALVSGIGVGIARATSAGQDEQAARVPADTPKEARDRENPIPADKRSLDYGKLLFSSQCVMCHGKQGKGDGDLVERLRLRVPDLTDPTTLEDRTDGDLFYVLSKGHGSMPGQNERFDEKTRWDLVNHVRTLPIDVQ